MSIFPDPSAGGLVIRDIDGNPVSQTNVLNAYVPPPAFVANCEITALPSDCTAKIEARHINAIVSEIVNFAECLDPDGPWDCFITGNLCNAFNAWYISVRGQPNGIASLDATGHVPLAQIPLIPGMEDEVQEHPTQSAFPATGDSGTIYIAADTSRMFRWNGAAYVELGAAADKVNKTGDTMTGFLTLSGAPTAPLHAATRQYVVDTLAAATGGTVAEAPNDGKLYGRKNLTWYQAVDPAGDTMTGFLTLPGMPTATLHAATKGYVDTQISPLNTTLNNKVAKAGDTMTGALNINTAAGANALSVSAGKALIDGGGAASFSTQMSVKGVAGTAAGNAYIYCLRPGGAEAALLWSDEAAGTVNLRSRGGQAVSVDASCNVSMGNQLTIGQAGNCRILYQPSNGDTYWYANASYYMRYFAGVFYFVSPSGNTLTINPNGFVSVMGQFACNSEAYKPGGGMWADISDSRVKTDVQDYTSGLNEILQLHPRTYHFAPETGRDTKKQYVGLIAQECEWPMPELVTQDQGKIGELEFSDMRTLDPMPLVFALINAVKTMTARIEALERQIADR